MVIRASMAAWQNSLTHWPNTNQLGLQCIGAILDNYRTS
jgi:hypothetical protein